MYRYGSGKKNTETRYNIQGMMASTTIITSVTPLVVPDVGDLWVMHLIMVACLSMIFRTCNPYVLQHCNEICSHLFHRDFIERSYINV